MPTSWEGLTPPYSTIVVDPPWHYDNFATMPGNANRKDRVMKREPSPYSSLSLEEIRALGAHDLAAANSRLFLWATNAYLPEAFGIMSAWGFRYSQTLVWHKTGNPSPFGGAVAPNHAEFLLVGICGSPAVLNRLDGSVIAAQKPYQHSLKPSIFLDLVEHCSPGPYVELFARNPRLGWDSWGWGYEEDR